jgi:predicted amidohydrolase YtcJ
VANSAALKIVGIDASTPNPTAGTIDRDAAGRPTGVLKEGAQDLMLARLPKTSGAEWQKGIEASLELMRREGMTGVKDPDISADMWDAYLALAHAGRLSAHVCTLWHTEPNLDSVRANIARLAALPKPPATAADNLTSCGVKIFMDGSGGGRTAWVYKDWYKNGNQVDTGNTGYPLWDPALYRQAVGLYTAAGVHIGTHAVGDRAIDWVVDSYAAVLREHPVKGLRHSIIHANTPTDHAIDVMAALERDFDAGYPETQGEFTWWIGDNYAGNLGPERLGRLNPYHTYLQRGIRWAGGSDFEVTPLPARLGLWASVARTPVKGTYGATPFGTAESVDAMTALRSYTVWAAHQLFLDAEAGTLEPGKSADIAVWDRDPIAVPTAAVKDMKCELTVFRGAVVYRADGSPITVAGPRAQ